MGGSVIHDLKQYPGSEEYSASRDVRPYDERVQHSGLSTLLPLQGVLQKQALYKMIARRQVSME